MKKIFRYSQGLLLAALAACPLMLTSCDDDDDVIVNPTPSEFAVELGTINVNWDESEGVIDIDANDQWKATTNAEWITVDPASGEAGEPRLYLAFMPNNYLLPRTAEVQIQCGEQTGVVTVTQGGCADAAQVKNVEFNMEVQSLDYATTEIDLSQYAKEIQGNLGLSMADFAAGVDDEGGIEFFMVNDGEWLKAGTAGTRCSAWLDKNLAVTTWNGKGYPSNACFIEVYGGENASLVVGRAPGVPDDAEFELNFGFTLANDHSKYLLFKVIVVFPKMDLGGTVVKTIDLTANIEANNEYRPAYIQFDADEVMAALGTTSITRAKVVAYDADGEFVSYTAGNGYWFDANGKICAWGADAGWFIEYHGEDGVTEPGAEEYAGWAIGPYPERGDMHGVSQIGLWYNQNVVMFNIDVTVGPVQREEE